MKILLLLLLSCCLICFAGTPGHETVVHCDFGCILAELPDGKESVICAKKQFIKISPDPEDGWYHIKIYSGFPLGHANDRSTTPRYEQDYTWWEDYGRVSLNVHNCVTVSPVMFIPLDIIGQCPPQKYDPPPHSNGGLKTNPYWYFYGPGRSYTTEPSPSDDDDDDDDEELSLINADASSSATISGLDDNPLQPLLFSEEGGEDDNTVGINTFVEPLAETLADTEAAASADDSSFILSSDFSNTNIFQQVDDDDDPSLLFLSDGNNNKINKQPLNMDFSDSSLISNELGGAGGQQDYSLFDEIG